MKQKSKSNNERPEFPDDSWNPATQSLDSLRKTCHFKTWPQFPPMPLGFKERYWILSLAGEGQIEVASSRQHGK